jgi:hypothetical protein
MTLASFSDLKKIKCYVLPQPCNYALDVDPPKNIHWDYCREQFAAKFNEFTSGFYFSHPKGKSYDVVNFFHKFETIVGISEMSTYAKTDKESILWVVPSEFWKDCQMKRSLMTIIIRCGINYDSSKDNFDDALFGDYKESVYVKETRSAILRFMFGFTKFTGMLAPPTSTVIKHGWREEFQKLDDSVIRRRLILPEGNSKELNVVGIDALWH